MLAVGALVPVCGFTFWRWIGRADSPMLTGPGPGAMLWFEHTLLAETHYVYSAWSALALAGTVFVRRPNWETFAGFLARRPFFHRRGPTRRDACSSRSASW